MRPFGCHEARQGIWDGIDKFLKKYNIQVDRIENLNNLLSVKETEYFIKNIHTEKIPDPVALPANSSRQQRKTKPPTTLLQNRNKRNTLSSKARFLLNLDTRTWWWRYEEGTSLMGRDERH